MGDQAPVCDVFSKPPNIEKKEARRQVVNRTSSNSCEGLKHKNTFIEIPLAK